MSFVTKQSSRPRFACLVFAITFAISSVCAVSNAADSELPIRDAKLISHWAFDKLPEGDRVGKVNVTAPGPTPPLYPGFDGDNQALSLKAPSYVVLPQNDDHDFSNGDQITVEAWVNATSLPQNAYIVGKGRTEKSGPKSTDQNWAVRLRKFNGQACLNFLFHSEDSPASEDNPATKGQWHRWTTQNGFAVDSGWHHVAVGYEFGKPDSIVGFIDGKKVDGVWDMGGQTTVAPKQTDSPVWIGSSIDGSKGNSFEGKIDELAIYRGRLPDEVLQARYRFERPEIKRPHFDEHQVAVELLGPFQGLSRIPLVAKSRRTWQQDTLAFTRLPFNYDSWGVREDWTTADKKSMLVRAWTDIQLEPGEYEFMIRSRGASELFVDGQRIASTPAQLSRSSAHNVVDPIPEVPQLGMRPHAMSDHERIVKFTSDGTKHELRFDVIVGGPKFRLEFGETAVAIAKPGDMFRLVSSRHHYQLTDDGWQNFVGDQSIMLDELDRQTRQEQAASQNEYWDLRHAYAKENLQTSPTPEKAPHASIDRLIAKRIANENDLRKTAASEPQSPGMGDAFYSDQVHPILASHCGRCHGEKRQGDLAIFDHSSLLAGGESGDAAVVPGDADASYLMTLIAADKDDYRMPPKGDGLSSGEIAIVRKWIDDGAEMSASIAPPIETMPIADDATFLRRIYIDTVGVPPSLPEAKAFLTDTATDRRERLVDRLLDDPRWADNWVGYWQDVLAENPNLLKPTLNNTGPFRYWIHEALVDNKPIDRFATELIQMRGSKWYGGAAGFSIASQNDVPMAAKAHVIATAFMGVELKCARCHDAPYHSWKQSDLFNLAAMLERKSIKLPKTSTVPAAFFQQQARESLIEVTLKPGETIHGDWPFARFAPDVEANLVRPPGDSRVLLAAQVTASRRFAEVIANRIWRRLMGAALVAPVDDWQGNPPSDPRLLAHLANSLIQNDYDVKRFAKEIFLSDAYRREAVPTMDEGRFFAGPYRRRMTAEQIVDSAFHVVGQTMRTEQLTMDVEGNQPADRFLNFGYPKRAWEFTTLANERDRPSLALPRIQAIADVLRAFGWRNSRPEPTSAREETPNLVQPGALANGTLGIWLTRLTHNSGLTKLMLQPQSVSDLVDDLFLQVLTRRPTEQERRRFVALLSEGYDERIETSALSSFVDTAKRFPYVSWSNHLHTEANVIKVEMTKLARQGPPPTRQLDPDWRSRAEDAVWALINSPEMIVIP